MFDKRFFIPGVFAAISLATCLLTCIAAFASSAFGSLGVATTKAPEPAAAPIQRNSDNLRAELNTALAPEFAFNFDTVGNPFADKTGVSLAVGEVQLNSGLSAGMPNANLPPTNRFTSFPNQIAMPGQNYPNGYQLPKNPIAALPSPPLQTVPGASAIGELLKERQRQIKLGNPVPPLASYFNIDDVRPYGIVGSGENNRVKLFDRTTGSRFALSKGMKLRDGSIEAIGDEGIRFKRATGEIVFIRWMKNKSKSVDNFQPDAPILRIENTSNK